MMINQQNLLKIRELKKKIWNKKVKIKNYASNKKVELNKKYFKTKRNQKFKKNFFSHFIFQIYWRSLIINNNSVINKISIIFL